MGKGELASYQIAIPGVGAGRGGRLGGGVLAVELPVCLERLPGSP